MAETTTKPSALDRALRNCRVKYQEMMARADETLEAHLTEHALKIQTSEARVASLEGDLEMMEYFERERDAARIRIELHDAVMAHRATVDAANDVLEARVRHYIQGLSAFGVALECGFNADLNAFRHEERK